VEQGRTEQPVRKVRQSLQQAAADTEDHRYDRGVEPEHRSSPDQQKALSPCCDFRESPMPSASLSREYQRGRVMRRRDAVAVLGELRKSFCYGRVMLSVYRFFGKCLASRSELTQLSYMPTDICLTKCRVALHR
jgi:hypothetical protein